MNKLLVQEFLETRSFADLALLHGVTVKFKNHKFSVNYDQIDSKESDPLACQCRGLILSSVDGSVWSGDLSVIPGKTLVLAYPMDRFFNLGQGAAANVNWNDCKVFKKLDGTLIILYFDPFEGKWHTATRQVSEADLKTNLYTFRELFEKALNDEFNLSFDQLVCSLDKNKTYCFELCSPFNKNVVAYNRSFISFIACRDLVSGQESFPDIIIPKCPVYSNNELNEASKTVNFVSLQNPSEDEGVVVCDSSYRRIKIKNPGYVYLSKIKDKAISSERNLMELILLGKEDDVIPLLQKEYVDIIENIKEGLRLLSVDIEEKFKSLKQKSSDRKSFALLIQEEKLWGDPLFSMYVGNSLSFSDFLHKKSKDGSWSNSFLDFLIQECKKKTFAT